jgi:hypothetical protein
VLTALHQPGGRFRRAAYVGLLGVLVASLTTACGTESDDRHVLASYTRGFSVVLTDSFVDAGGVDRVEAKDYSDLQQLYNDLLSGKAAMTIGGPDVFASQAQQGAPIHIAATISPNSTAFVGKQVIDNEADLKGKRVAAIATSGGWHLAEAVIEQEFGLRAGQDYEVVNVPDMASGTSQVVAGTADYSVGWEPSVTASLAVDDSLKLAYSVAGAASGETFGDGWQLVLAVRDDVDKEVEADVVSALQDAAESLQSDHAQADAYAVENGFEKGTVSAVMDQKVPPFVVEPLDDTLTQQIRDQLERTPGDDGPLDPPDSFFGDA